MPYKKGRGKYMKKKGYKKRYHKKSIPLGLGFPKSKLVKLRYCTSVSLNSGVATVSKNSFRANGLYDPDQTGTGHQPIYFDVFQLLYDHYTVLGARCTASFGVTSTNAGTAIIGIMLNDDSAYDGGTTVNDYVESGKGTWKVLTMGSSSSKMENSVSMNMSTKKWFGVKNPVDSDGLRGICNSGNPSEEVYFIVYTGSVNPATDAAALDVLVVIDYIILFTEPRDIAQS